MKTMIDDIKAFIKEHRGIIYFVVILLIIDRFFLDGKMTHKIRAMAEKFFTVVEKKLDKATGETEAKP